MKTFNFKYVMMLFVLLVVKPIHAQHVNIEGKIKDVSGKRIKAQYVLTCDDEKMYTSSGSKIKLRFKPNHTYRVTFSKPGYATKTISFTTNSRNHDKFVFCFDITLKELPAEKLREEGLRTNVADVYYDAHKHTYAYSKY
jgi:hypothetical protein